MNNGIGSGAFWGVIWGLVAFAVIYNRLIAWLSKRGHLDPYVGFAVIFGVMVTLGGVALLDWRAALLASLCFAASGAPMTIGSMWRFLEAYRAGDD